MLGRPTQAELPRKNEQLWATFENIYDEPVNDQNVQQVPESLEAFSAIFETGVKRKLGLPVTFRSALVMHLQSTVLDITSAQP